MAKALAMAKPSQLPLHHHVIAPPFFPPCTPSYKPRTRPSSSNLSTLRCSASSPRSPGACRAAQSRRRSVSISTTLLLAPFPHRAIADGGILDKYVKTKKLDPLDAYVLAVILTQLQIEDLARYASESGDGNTAFNDVDRCLRALEELDSFLLHASMKEPDASVSSMKAKRDVAVNALDSICDHLPLLWILALYCLLRTVPENILDKGKAIADADRGPADEESVIEPPDQAVGINFMKTRILEGISSHYERLDRGSSSSMVLGSARSLHYRKAEHW